LTLVYFGSGDEGFSPAITLRNINRDEGRLKRLVCETFRFVGTPN
jgi:hypothetical protein